MWGLFEAAISTLTLAKMLQFLKHNNEWYRTQFGKSLTKMSLKAARTRLDANRFQTERNRVLRAQKVDLG